jgi:hypothetical protein
MNNTEPTKDTNRKQQWKDNVAYLLKARTVEPQKEPVLNNGCVMHNNGVTVGSGVFCVVCARAI